MIANCVKGWTLFSMILLHVYNMIMYIVSKEK